MLYKLKYQRVKIIQQTLSSEKHTKTWLLSLFLSNFKSTFSWPDLSCATAAHYTSFNIGF